MIKGNSTKLNVEKAAKKVSAKNNMIRRIPTNKGVPKINNKNEKQKKPKQTKNFWISQQPNKVKPDIEIRNEE